MISRSLSKAFSKATIFCMAALLLVNCCNNRTPLTRGGEKKPNLGLVELHCFSQAPALGRMLNQQHHPEAGSQAHPPWPAGSSGTDTEDARGPQQPCTHIIADHLPGVCQQIHQARDTCKEPFLNMHSKGGSFYTLEVFRTSCLRPLQASARSAEHQAPSESAVDSSTHPWG